MMYQRCESYQCCIKDASPINALSKMTLSLEDLSIYVFRQEVNLHIVPSLIPNKEILSYHSYVMSYTYLLGNESGRF